MSDYTEMLEQLKRTKFATHNGQGFVQLKDVMGGDQSVCEAARLTAQSKGVAADIVKSDTNLLRYLMRHRHTTPMEFCELVLHVRVPMDTWRQWIRHRTANVNEYSTRYSEAIDESATTPPDKWRMQSKSNRQGSAGALASEWPNGYQLLPMTDDGDIYMALVKEEVATHRGWGLFTVSDPEINDDLTCLAAFPDKLKSEITPGLFLTQDEQDGLKESRARYEQRLKFGVAKEQARKDLPLSTFTEAYWKIDLNNLFKFLSLRMDAHAQLEIRECAAIIGHNIVAKVCPILWQAFLDYDLQAMRLTAIDISVIKAAMLVGAPPWDAKQLAAVLPVEWVKAKEHRERTELLVKLRDLDLTTFEASTFVGGQ